MQNLDAIKQLLASQQDFFGSGTTRSLMFRDQQLKILADTVFRMEKEIYSALAADLGKPEMESFTSEFAFVIEEIRFTRKNLRRWMKPRSLPSPVHLQPGKTEIYREPLGCTLVISPWNYPFQLALAPVVSAIAAGNCVILKPSELAPRTSALLAKLVASAFSPKFFAVVEGGVPETTALLTLPFQHIFFTGSTRVGRVVYEAAAKTLTPVTLELGGKSPVIIAADADLDLAARRVAWGRFMNAGQTCVAPDYAFVHESVAEKFLEKLRENIETFYGKNPKESKSFARIVNGANLRRLASLLTKEKIVAGGEFSEADLYFAPTVLFPASWDDPAMKEEIFGPILPVLPFSDLAAVFREIRNREKPLAAYLFSGNSATQREFLELSFGGGCVNDTVVHLSNPHAPFGGVGASGIGAYHGERGFLTFSHQKSVLRRTRWLDLSVRYPPYSSKKISLLRKLLRIGKS